MKKENLQSWLARRIALEIGSSPDSVDVNAPILGYFLNGFQSWRVVLELENVVGFPLPDSILYECSTIAELAEYLADPLYARPTATPDSPTVRLPAIS